VTRAVGTYVLRLLLFSAATQVASATDDTFEE
jgi:hypothetical protein